MNERKLAEALDAADAVILRQDALIVHLEATVALSEEIIRRYQALYGGLDDQ